MEISKTHIDNGKSFDWERASDDYARYRDIYPYEFYQRILDMGLCRDGQKVLDVGTGTGVLPRNMYQYGAEWVGTDIAEKQIEAAKKLAAEARMNIQFKTVATEDISFPPETFDVITACQCFFYFDHAKIANSFANMLKKEGRLLILYMAWLPFEDNIAKASEDLILQYNPVWSGCNETRRKIRIPEVILNRFGIKHEEIYDVDIFFTRESWHGRVKACRGIGASLTPEELSEWEKNDIKMLEKTAPKQFFIKHYVALAELMKQ